MSRCPAEPYPAEAFWIGIPEECVSYLAVYPTALGNETVLEGKKAWAAQVNKELLRAAASAAKLLADRDGMTAKAYNIWYSAGLTRNWWDADVSAFVPESQVPNK